MPNDNLPTAPTAPTPETPPAPVRRAIPTGGQVAPLNPQDFDSTWRMAVALSKAGDMVPKDFRDKPEACLAAIQRGAEVGLAPMQALASIAVINGRASLWGDALPAIMQKHGHQIDVKIENGDDPLNMKAVATLVRGDTGQRFEREFSAKDAQKANLWNKPGPWTQYPKRMLMMRARAWVVRDGAADAMMGLAVAEEVQDFDSREARDVTPKEESVLARRVREQREADLAEAQRQAAPPADVVLTQEAKEEVKEEPPKAEAKEEIEDAELVEDEAAAVEDLVDRAGDDVDPTSDAYAAGARAYQKDKTIKDCPFKSGKAMLDWLGGFADAKKAAS